MLNQKVIELVRTFDRDQQSRWMLDLGSALTVAARAAYPAGERSGNLEHLVAFNEMQHNIYNRMRRFQSGDDAWQLEAFLEGLNEKAKASGVDNDLGWAITFSLRRLRSLPDENGLNAEASETTRKEDLEQVLAHAESVFGDKEKALQWLRSPVPALGGHTPSEMLSTESGVKQVDQILARIEFGIFS